MLPRNLELWFPFTLEQQSREGPGSGRALMGPLMSNTTPGSPLTRFPPQMAFPCRRSLNPKTLALLLVGVSLLALHTWFLQASRPQEETWDGSTEAQRSARSTGAPCVANDSVRATADFERLPARIQDFLRYRHCRHFPLLWDAPAKCAGPRGAFLLLAVKSSPANYERRELIRRTWGQERSYGGQQVRRLFLLGTAAPGDADAERAGAAGGAGGAGGARAPRRAAVGLRRHLPQPHAQARAPARLAGGALPARALPAQLRRRRVRAHRQRAALPAGAAARPTPLRGAAHGRLGAHPRQQEQVLRAPAAVPGEGLPGVLQRRRLPPVQPHGRAPARRRPPHPALPHRRRLHGHVSGAQRPGAQQPRGHPALRRAAARRPAVLLRPLPVPRAAARAPLRALRDAAHVEGPARPGAALCPGPQDLLRPAGRRGGLRGASASTRHGRPPCPRASSLPWMPSLPPAQPPTLCTHLGRDGEVLGPGPISTISDCVALGGPQSPRYFLSSSSDPNVRLGRKPAGRDVFSLQAQLQGPL
uniref:Hexosyltransferase n=1 Tax=Canis lupus familiaris TaxID=9615 RepID=A0A8C0P511_CANLF